MIGTKILADQHSLTLTKNFADFSGVFTKREWKQVETYLRSVFATDPLLDQKLNILTPAQFKQTEGQVFYPFPYASPTATAINPAIVVKPKTNTLSMQMQCLLDICLYLLTSKTINTRIINSAKYLSKTLAYSFAILQGQGELLRKAKPSIATAYSEEFQKWMNGYFENLGPHALKLLIRGNIEAVLPRHIEGRLPDPAKQTVCEVLWMYEHEVSKKSILEFLHCLVQQKVSPKLQLDIRISIHTEP